QLLKGAERGYEEAISQLGQSQRLVPKRTMIIVVPDELVERTVKTIIQVNQTGKSGDGMIFVMPCLDSIRVRTAERGEVTLDDV
ncbi:MAG: P-II family nitrogen regulator, partial [Desulfosarcinaceae bacterium]